MTELDDNAQQGLNWADIALEAAQGGFGVPDSAASADSDESAPTAEPPRIPLRPGSSRNGRRGARDKGAASSAREAKKPSPLPPYREGMFVQPLTELYGWLGMSMMLVDPMCGTAIIQSAEACAVSLDKLAKQNHAVRRMLVMITQGSALGAVIAAHMPIIMCIVLHHVPGATNLLGSLGTRLVEGMMNAQQQQQQQEETGEAPAA